MRVEKVLQKVLLKGESFALALYEYELEENLNFYINSRIKDKDKYFLAITENSNDVAMVLINDKNQVLVNNLARKELQNYWGNNYENNMNKLIPKIAQALAQDLIYITGIKELNKVKH